MPGRGSLCARGTALFLVLGGGLTLPGFTAPRRNSARRPAPARKAAAPAVNLDRPAPAAARPAAAPLPATPPPGDRIMHISEVKPGMKGYGLTVFRGTKIERFNVEVVGVLPKQNLGQPLVLVRLSGGPISERAAYLIQGMSGSPIYIDGKLLGAFAYGNAWPKEPLGMVTPIEDMLEALDPKLPDTQAGQLSLGEPLSRPNPAGADVSGVFRSPLEIPSVTAGAQTFRPLALPVAVSGLSGRNLSRAAEILAPFNMAVMQGPGSMPEPINADLTPGAAMGVALMTGDVEMTGIGTVTYRKGDRILGFGHPMMQIGAAQFPLTTAFIHDVFPGFQSSFKIGSAGEICGTINQDRPFGVAGRIGAAPPMVPIRCHIVDTGTGRSKTFNVKAANHPMLVGQLLPLAVNQALQTVRPVPGDVVAYVSLTAETDGAGTIKRDNVFYDPAAIDVTAVRELQELMQILSSNSFRRVPVKNLELEVKFEDKLPTATVERIYLSQDKFEPGEDAEVGVVLRPYRKDPVVLKTKVHVPENAANGQAILLVQGGATRVNLSAITQGGTPSTLSAPPPDANLGQVLKR
ncbi:MAG TPA: SpoIVB peptidase S55 domain-containing protein, partial [Armatimonadota bacterium]|nr:SpoIVB peptidase S55 domain-containing protein [Armatimonadota bacterium]